MNIAIILAGGTGTRMGTDCPKQYILVNNYPVIYYSTYNFIERNDIDKIVIVADNKWHDFIRDNITSPEKISFAKPGESRQESIRNGLKICKQLGASESDVVIIHDAARPFVSNKIIDNCICSCKNHDGGMPVLKVKDTIYQSDNGHSISKLLDRDTLRIGQAPESFRFGKYYDINVNLTDNEIKQVRGSSEIAFRNGLDIVLFEGDEKNFKITTYQDLVIFKMILDKKFDI